ncbi:MAG: HD domain-containing protein [Oscillospiraceae bacterium]
MYPDIEIAERELKTAQALNPGPWIRHSFNTGLAARLIAEKVEGMNPEKAYVLGLLHDIGRRVGIVSIPRHVYEGYRYAQERRWEQVARICMTHSYPLMQKEFDFIPQTEEDRVIKEYISQCTCDAYDRLIQLCDSLAADYGFCILEKRFVDVARRYGIFDNMIERWNKLFEIKEHFETQMGSSVYDVLPDIGQTTLLCPPPWQPPVKS